MLLTLSVETSPDQLQGAYLWSTDSEDRDFRDEEWTSLSIDEPLQKNIEVQVDFPESGYRAFYLDLEYSDPLGGAYTKSTRMFVTDGTGVLED
jgi:PhoPQ-activated pathogenicity-related protein